MTAPSLPTGAAHFLQRNLDYRDPVTPAPRGLRPEVFIGIFVFALFGAISCCAFWHKRYCRRSRGKTAPDKGRRLSRRRLSNLFKQEPEQKKRLSQLGQPMGQNVMTAGVMCSEEESVSGDSRMTD